MTESDNEMDERAVEAVKAAINKAKICKKPIAGYDKEKKGLKTGIPHTIISKHKTANDERCGEAR